MLQLCVLTPRLNRKMVGVYFGRGNTRKGGRWTEQAMSDIEC